jgi:hypothetical protein
MTTSALSPTLISSVPELKAFLSSIPPSSTLYLDLEGILSADTGPSPSSLCSSTHSGLSASSTSSSSASRPSLQHQRAARLSSPSSKTPASPNAPGTSATTPMRCGLSTMSVSLASLIFNSSRMRVAPATGHMFAD